MASVKFSVGEIVEHLRFGYRGVVYGVDPEFSLSEAWYERPIAGPALR